MKKIFLLVLFTGSLMAEEFAAQMERIFFSKQEEQPEITSADKIASKTNSKENFEKNIIPAMADFDSPDADATWMQIQQQLKSFASPNNDGLGASTSSQRSPRSPETTEEIRAEIDRLTNAYNKRRTDLKSDLQKSIQEKTKLQAELSIAAEQENQDDFRTQIAVYDQDIANTAQALAKHRLAEASFNELIAKLKAKLKKAEDLKNAADAYTSSSLHRLQEGMLSRSSSTNSLASSTSTPPTQRPPQSWTTERTAAASPFPTTPGQQGNPNNTATYSKPVRGEISGRGGRT